MLDIKSLLTNILKILVLKSGFTMTGELKNSDSAVAIGSQQATSNTIPNLVNELRYSSGALGSVNITTSYTGGGVTIGTGWYNYCYIPHRSGGKNGRAESDNHNHGNLLLFGMTISNHAYDLRISSGSIADVYKWDFSEPTTVDTSSSGTTGRIQSISTTNYSIETSAGRTNFRKLGRLVVMTMGVTAKSPVTWSSVFASGAPVPYQAPVYGALCTSEGGTHSSMAVSINSSGQVSGSGGVANKLYYGTIYYIASS